MFFFVCLAFASGSSLAKMTVVYRPVACKNQAHTHNLKKTKMRYYFLTIIDVQSFDQMPI